MKKKLAICDFDGFFVDTEPKFKDVWAEWFMEKYKISISKDFWNSELKGISSKSKSEKIGNRFGIFVSDDELRKIYEKCIEYILIPGNMELTKGIVDVLELFDNRCIATGGIIEGTKKKLDALGIQKYFAEEHIFTIEHVEKGRGKPHPDMFLLAAEKMGFAPEDCIVFEDGIPGLEAAIAAGMMPVAYLEYVDNREEFIKIASEKGVEYFYDNAGQLEKDIHWILWGF